MRTHGNLTKWNDDRGFGFIAPASGGADVFVHISAFPRDGQRPTINEIVSYETETGPDGKKRAVKIMRPGQQRTRPARRIEQKKEFAGIVQTVIAVLLIGGIAGYGYTRFRQSDVADTPTQASLETTRSQNDSRFSCDGRTMCSQMTSCEEARYFVQHCPNTKMDGNGDGEPCEQQWCN
jgi:cold shock CspA family protein